MAYRLVATIVDGKVRNLVRATHRVDDEGARN
jgi:hypothetical protein